MNREPISRSEPADPAQFPSAAPPQFRLRTLLLVVAAFSVLFTVVQAVGLFSSLMLLMLLGLIAAHVIGNALGTRLRDEASRLAQAGGDAADPPPPTGELPMKLPASQLTERRQLPRRLFGIATLGAVLGGVSGGALITAVTWQDITVAGIALGVCSSAVLGGLAGFLASSFYTVARAALREALAEQPQKYKPQ
jgi:hypothetical protein